MTDEISHPAQGGDELRTFGFTFGFVAAAGAGLLLWRGRMALGASFVIASVVFSLLGAFLPRLLRPFYGPWMRFAEALGYINTRVLLGLFYLVGITPTGLLMRISGKDPMNRTFKQQGTSSYWTKPFSHGDGTRHFDRQF